MLCTHTIYHTWPQSSYSYPPAKFRARLKSILADTINHRSVGAHSLRRGGACFLYSINTPIDTIRMLGDWKSNAYVAYVKPTYPVLEKAIRLMATKAAST